MQTFLPYKEFVKCAECLDNKRLGKQRVECKQILLALEVPVGEHKPKSSSWRNHPAVKMWRGYEFILAQYSCFICAAWIGRGFKDKLMAEFVAVMRALQDQKSGPLSPILIGDWLSPPWLGSDVLHASHRSNLLRKDKDHYGKFGWEEPDCLPYFWPV